MCNITTTLVLLDCCQHPGQIEYVYSCRILTCFSVSVFLRCSWCQNVLCWHAMMTAAMMSSFRERNSFEELYMYVQYIQRGIITLPCKNNKPNYSLNRYIPCTLLIYYTFTLNENGFDVYQFHHLIYYMYHLWLMYLLRLSLFCPLTPVRRQVNLIIHYPRQILADRVFFQCSGKGVELL